MLRLLTYALVPVLIGAAVAFVPGVDRRWFRPVHTFAFAAALTVVFAVLLPGAVAEAGVQALVVFAAGLIAPGLLDRGVRHFARRRDAHDHEDGLGLELAFGGLLVHQAVDGLQIGTSGVIEDGLTVVLAVAAHTTPLVAVTVLAYAHHDGRRAALGRAAALALATAIGVAIGAGASMTWLVPVEPWLRAAVAGVLLTILGHDLADTPPATARGKLGEGLVTLAGMGLPLLWVATARDPHDHGGRLDGAVLLVLVAVVGLQLAWLLGVIPRRLPTSGGHAHAPHSSSDV